MGRILRPHWGSRPHKALARDLLLRESLALETVSYAGLPGASAIFEKALASSMSVSSMRLFEKISKLFEVLESSLSGINCSNIHLYNDEIESISSDDMSELNLIWLDYCGPLTLNRLSFLETLVPLIARRKGILAATYLAGREPTSFSAAFLPNSEFKEDFIQDYFSTHGALELSGLSRVGTVSKAFLKDPFEEMLAALKLLSFNLNTSSGKRTVWAADMIAASSYGSIDFTLSSSLAVPFALYKRIKFLYSFVESMGYKFSLKVQPYADHVPMLLFIFSFVEDHQQNGLSILPYLKGSNHDYEYTDIT